MFLVEPLALIHGSSGIPAMWEPMLPALQERFDVRPLGLAGHFGCAALPEGVTVTPTAIIDAIEADLDAAGLDTVHFCGNSLGGWAALELANRGRALSCTALSPAGGWDAGDKDDARLKRLFKRLHKTSNGAAPRSQSLFSRPRLRKLAFRDALQERERRTPRHAAL